MQEVEAICDRVIIINNGEIVADDKIQNINNNKENNQVVKVLFENAVDIGNFTSKTIQAKNIEGNQWIFTSIRNMI